MSDPFDVPWGLYSAQGTLGDTGRDLVREAEFVLHRPSAWPYPPASLPAGFRPSRFAGGCRYELIELPFTMPTLIGDAWFAWVELTVGLLDTEFRILRIDPQAVDVEWEVPQEATAAVRERPVGSLEHQAVVSTWSLESGLRWRFTGHPRMPIREGDARTGVLLELPGSTLGLRVSLTCRVEVVRAEVDGDEAVEAESKRKLVADVPF